MTRMRHGTTSMYTAGKCRCEPCRSAMRDYQRAYTAKRKASLPRPANQLRACEGCGEPYVVLATSRNKFCTTDCANVRRSTCKKCRGKYVHDGIHYSVDPSLCPECLTEVVNEGCLCPICEIPWWAPTNDHCCSAQCRDLLAAKSALIGGDQ